MDISAELSAPCSVPELFSWIDDLSRYTPWMGLVHRADRVEDRDGRPAWDVELRARIGPFSRSKRLTMTRVVCRTNAEVVFERSETDERQHSMWRLSAMVAATKSTTTSATGFESHLEMRLHYGGGLWTGGLVERALADEINNSRDRLLSLIAGTTP